LRAWPILWYRKCTRVLSTPSPGTSLPAIVGQKSRLLWPFSSPPVPRTPVPLTSVIVCNMFVRVTVYVCVCVPIPDPVSVSVSVCVYLCLCLCLFLCLFLCLLVFACACRVSEEPYFPTNFIVGYSLLRIFTALQRDVRAFVWLDVEQGFVPPPLPLLQISLLLSSP